jgi:hypothetical protein
VTVSVVSLAPAQRAVRQLLEHRLDRGVLERQHPLACHPARRRGLGGGADLLGREPGELLVVLDDDRAVLGRREHALAERGRVRRQLLVQRLQGRLVGVGQLRAGADERVLVAIEQLDRLGIEPELVALLVERVDAREQRGVEEDRVRVRRQLRRDLGLDLLHRIVAVALVQVEEHLRHARQEAPGALERDDRVVERRRGGILRDRVDLLALLGHAAFERRHVIRVVDLVERRQVIRQRAGREERIRRRGRRHRRGDWRLCRRGCGCGCGHRRSRWYRRLCRRGLGAAGGKREQHERRVWFHA